jgi:hypothetical protein
VDKLKDVPQSAKSGSRTPTKKKGSKKSPKKNTRRKTNVAKKKTKKSSGFRLPGGLGPKGILSGILGLALIPQFVPVTTPGQAKLATGIALRALKLSGGGALSSVGIMEVAAEMLLPRLGGLIPGGSGAQNAGGYDY